MWLRLRTLRAVRSRVRTACQGDKKCFKPPLVHLLRDNKRNANPVLWNNSPHYADDSERNIQRQITGEFCTRSV